MLTESFGKQTSVCTFYDQYEKMDTRTYALPVYGASQVDLNTIQCFLERCNKRRYTSELINIYDLLEKCDRRSFTKIKNNVNHALYALLPKVRVIQEVKITNKSITTD